MTTDIEDVFKEISNKILNPPKGITIHYYSDVEEYYDGLLIEIDETLTKYPELVNYVGKDPYCNETFTYPYTYHFKLYGNLLHVACKTIYVCDKIINLLVNRGFDTYVKTERGYTLPLEHSRDVDKGRQIGDFSGQKHWSKAFEYYFRKLPDEVIDYYFDKLWLLNFKHMDSFYDTKVQLLVKIKVERQKEYYEKLLQEQKEQLLHELYKPEGLGYKMAKRRFEE